MDINLKILHLRQPLRYAPMERPERTDEKNIDRMVSRFGECILVFGESEFSSMTDDGPRLSASLVPRDIYHAATKEEFAAFSLAAGDYLFFQWRSRGREEKPASPSFSSMLEEILREAWWQRFECDGPWYVRLVPEDGSTAVQALRKLQRVP